MQNSILNGAWIQAVRAGDQVEVTLLMSRFDAPVFSDRLPTATRSFRRWLSKEAADSHFPVPYICILVAGIQSGMADRLRRIDKRLTSLVETPVAPSAVEKYLGITGRERIRWMKDGRLPSSAHGRSSRTKETFRVHYYKAGLVSELCTKPEVIRAWRQADAALEG